MSGSCSDLCFFFFDGSKLVDFVEKRATFGLLPCRVHYQSHDSWPLTCIFAVALVTANLKLFISCQTIMRVFFTVVTTDPITC